MPRKTSPENDLIISAGGAAPRRQAATHSRSKRNTRISEVSASPDAAITTLEPSQDEIAALAFSYWEARGCQGGSPEEDWLRAEQHLRSLQAVAANA